MIIGEIQPEGIAHPLAVRREAPDVIGVYTVHTHTRVVSIRDGAEPRWDGWCHDDPAGRDAIVRAAVALRDRAVRTCDG